MRSNKTTQHDVIAFLTAWADNTTPRSAAAYVHHGMTSSDLLDTALAIQLTEATDILLAKTNDLVVALRDHALEHKATLRVGRTHGIHAEPDVWGHRVADFAFAMARSRDRLQRARAAVGVCAISGGRRLRTPTSTPPFERYVAEKLNLTPATVSTQVVMRDGISEWGKRARHRRERLRGDRTRDQAWPAHRGSRAVGAVRARPKGLIRDAAQKEPDRFRAHLRAGRIIRAQVTPVMEGIALWHERDISHSSVERIALPDAAIGTDYVLQLTTRLIKGLTVDADRNARQPRIHRRPDLLLGRPA